MQRIWSFFAIGLASAAAAVSVTAQAPTRTVPAGTLLDLHLLTALSAKTTKLETPFDSRLLSNVPAQGTALLPAGAPVRGFVSSVRPTGGIDHQSQLTLSFDEVRIGEQPLRLRASVVAVLAVRRTEDLSRLGTTPVVGATVDVRPSPMVGVLIGPGGSILSTNGDNVNLPIGCVLRIRLDRAIDIPPDK